MNVIFKPSAYLVFSDILNDRNERIVFSTRSCKALLISHACFECLEAGALNVLPESLRRTLANNQIIVPASEDERLSILDENRTLIEANHTSLYEVIQPSANCQLGCYYCGQTHAKKTLDDSVAERIVMRIQNKILTGKYQKLDVGWFGGEPLMALQTIRLISRQLIEFCQQHNTSYTAKVVTNGMSLKPAVFEELVTEMNVRQIEITLDGTGDFHDAHRYTKQREGSFDIIFQNLLNVLAIKARKKLDCILSIRCNVDKQNVDGVKDLIGFLAENNLQGKINFYTMNVYSWAGNDAHKQSLTKEEFAQKEIEWRKEMIRTGFAYGFDMPKRKKITCMITSKDAEMFDAFGNVFNCSETSYSPFYENSPYKLGNVNHTTGISTTRYLQNWNDIIQQEETLPCHTCVMLPVCGGSCPKSWREGNVACPTNKFNLKEKLALNYKILKARETHAANTKK